MHINISLIIILFCSISGVVLSQWFELSSGTNEQINSVFFLDESLGWAAGNNILLKSSDGGDNWMQIQLSGNNNSVFFINDYIGWVCNSDGKILKTTDGGNNWVINYSLENLELTSISFLNENIGIASGYNRTILVTSDGGENWISTLSQSYDHLLKTYIYSADLMFVMGGNGLVYRSTDSGANWDSLNVGMPNALYGISFISPLTGFVFGCCGAYFKTTDGGDTWQNHDYITPGDIIYSSSFVDEYTGWAVGEIGWLLKTTDGGDTWFENGPPKNEEYRSIIFVNEDVGFVVGSNGTILKTVNGGGSSTSVSENGDLTPVAFQLCQNYPNPFNPTTIISYSVPENSYVTLKVYDILSNVVTDLVNERKEAGNCSVSFDASGLSSGIYFYQLQTSNFIQTKKMVLLK